MLFFIIPIISILALLVDWYIYKRVIARHNFGQLWKVGYAIYTVTIDLAVLIALIFYSSILDSHSDVMFRLVMWVIFIFFLHALPKIIYAAISLGDYIVQFYTKRRSHIFGYTGSLLAVVAFCVMLWGATFGRSGIEVRTVELVSNSLPASFDELRVVQFSDTHIGNLINSERILGRMVEAINDLDADIVINSGDLVNLSSDELTMLIMKVLEKIESRYGVFSVMGNHDLGFYMRDTTMMTPMMSVESLIGKQHAMGWTMLINQTAFINNGKDSVSVSGINFPSGYKHNGHNNTMSGVDFSQTYASVPDSSFNIMISHAPQPWDEIIRLGKSELTLSGHVHAMQMKFRLGSLVWSPARWMYERWSGLYSDGDKHLYINDGIGYVMYPMRIGTRPELTLITIKSAR